MDWISFFIGFGAMASLNIIACAFIFWLLLGNDWSK